MAKETRGKALKNPAKYERVILADIRRNRRGKHHDLLAGIFQDLESLPRARQSKFHWQRWMGLPWRTCDPPSIARRSQEALGSKLCQTKKTSIFGRL